MTDSLPQFVQHYIAQLRQGNRDNAFHSLIEADPAIVPLLIAEFAREPDATFRNELLRVIAEFRSADTISFFTERLFDAHWKAALDFFVGQASPEALSVLERARPRRFDSQRETDQFRSWLEEAIAQAQAAQRT
jgi:succinate dehydrogenase flavin-adding protein (antitoxin of CptAB toxin-antitoxin module)